MIPPTISPTATPTKTSSPTQTEGPTDTPTPWRTHTPGPSPTGTVVPNFPDTGSGSSSFGSGGYVLLVMLTSALALIGFRIRKTPKRRA